jgi:ABC-2 type transport system ATP-binding protein
MDSKVIAANEVLSLLRSKADQGVEKALDFAIQFARKSEKRYDLIIYSASYHSEDMPEKRQEIIAKIIGLVEWIRDEIESPEQKKKLALETSNSSYFAKEQSVQSIVFTCENLEYAFSSKFKLSDINLTLKTGEITGVVGENANGKTTLCRIIAGDLEHDKGNIAYPLIDPEAKFDWEQIKKSVAFLSQESQGESWYQGVRTTLQIYATLNGIPEEDRDLAIDFMIQRLGLSKYENYTWKKLSGGYKLRFRLACLLLSKPRLLVLDEPLANLDIKAQITVLNDLRDMAKSTRFPLSIVITSQHIHEIESIADNVIHLRDGKIIWSRESYKAEAQLENCFEFACNLALPQLRNLLSGIVFNNLVFDGISYILTAPSELTAGDFLMLMVENGVEIQYFRDITHSAKKSILLN